MPNIRFIVLTDEQAAIVRGEYANNAELDPRLMDNKAAMLAAAIPYPSWGGNADFYVVPYRVLFDPDFASVSGYLSAISDYTLNIDIIFLPPEE